MTKPERNCPAPEKATNTPSTSGQEPYAYRVSDAVRMSGLGRTKLYELIKSGELRSIRVGGRRLVPADGLKALLQVK